MIAVDTNILVYAHRKDSPWHAVAFQRIKSLAEKENTWVIPWPCIHEFLSIVTHPKIFNPPSTLEQIHDMRIASICLESGVSEPWSADRDFSRSRIKTVNPLLENSKIHNSALFSSPQP